LPTDGAGVIVAFDTHSSVKNLAAAGMPEAQAEAITELFKTARGAGLAVLATKTDLAEQRSELRQLIAEVRADLRHQIAEAKADILKWMFGMPGGAVLINVMAVAGAMLAVVRIVGH
jgi:NAD(P)-dependent dehydrogenase (short-subunit alcohol dehydrogenase family)